MHVKYVLALGFFCIDVLSHMIIAASQVKFLLSSASYLRHFGAELVDLKFEAPEVEDPETRGSARKL